MTTKQLPQALPPDSASAEAFDWESWSEQLCTAMITYERLRNMIADRSEATGHNLGYQPLTQIYIDATSREAILPMLNFESPRLLAAATSRNSPVRCGSVLRVAVPNVEASEANGEIVVTERGEPEIHRFPIEYILQPTIGGQEYVFEIHGPNTGSGPSIAELARKNALLDPRFPQTMNSYRQRQQAADRQQGIASGSEFPEDEREAFE